MVVQLGSSVRVRDGDIVESWRIVDPSEADPRSRYISSASPLAAALLGHQAGEQVRVQAPDRWRPVTILEVR